MTDIASTHRNLDALQLRRKTTIRIVVAALGPLLVLATGSAQPDSLYRESLEAAGIMLIVVGILGRTWCTLYIGGRKARTLVADGPYSVSRNPLYLFAFVAAAGLGAQSGSLIVASLFVVGAYAIFVPVVRHEEIALGALFGAEFDAYRKRVPRFLPRLSQWQDAPILMIDPKHYRQTALDGLILLAFVPAFYAAEWVRTLVPGLPILHLP
ncbi:methyltransferase family protein [Aurantimonas endophytica]|uniref:Protein-S-isoprenylcysteine O-methyltransferase Ste14 n=1 Tax=Aurantimonas endophytica TaxID=1522175 RepID=A0A7W6HB32_9HYPH|nr:isoprenylcysteine carboxylmethyltransferase family protein [Aurantimonas endophytica]MBB4001857.1 protein-S-isoprenylcysteine O-methyltransferase Ste14 [Aurantimonas endophytica]MCO6402507.1 isoprenylcysteine carboxylmethyltransferase family protein [Aurantimonas endophytica]